MRRLVGVFFLTESVRNEFINDAYVIAEVVVNKEVSSFNTNISTELQIVNNELQEIENKICESEATIKRLTPECDKTDYILAASCGVLSGIMDVFLVGKPGESPIGELSDQWFENRTKSFARICGWKSEDNSVSSAIGFLEKKFKIPYDQTGTGGLARYIADLNTRNHHFKSLGHNPTLLGLFFSILDQFSNTSHFISNGEMISIQEASGNFVLRGKSVPGKLVCGFINWFGHLISDVSGSSKSKGRGMGIPSPIWSWTNDIIAIKRGLGIPAFEFEKTLNELAVQIYKEGFDTRFQAAQFIPVFVNETLVRIIYSTRRLIQYYLNVNSENKSLSLLWQMCEPFSNATVKRMLTVAHGTFCMIDIGDAIARGIAAGGGTLNPKEFLMRLNIAGIGRFTISLYGEANRNKEKKDIKKELIYLKREK